METSSNGYSEEHTMIRRASMICIAILTFTVVATVRAQFTANFQTNTINGVTSNWMGSYVVGNTNYLDTLLIQSGNQNRAFSRKKGL
jgi:hypothetical protein